MRVFELADALALHEVLGDARAMWWLTEPWRMSETELWIRSCMEAQANHGWSLWALVAKDTGEVIGDCGVAFRAIAGNDEYELGYHVRRDLWGRGIATEAACAARDYARDILGIKRLVAITLPDNFRSRRVMEKVGMTFERDFDQANRDGEMQPRVLYSITF